MSDFDATAEARGVLDVAQTNALTNCDLDAWVDIQKTHARNARVEDAIRDQGIVARLRGAW